MSIFKNLRNYFLIKKSHLFDSEYYLSNNEDVKKSKMNPILHYLQFGWKEGRNPSPLFNTNDYISFRPDIVKADICPLVHYELFGKEEFLSLFFHKIKQVENENKQLNNIINNKLKDLESLNKKVFDLERFKYEIGFTYKNGINKEKVSYEIEKYFEFSESGISNEQRKFNLIVSLTSYPDRMYDIHYAIYSLFKQNLKPDKIILWLGEDKFPNKDKDLPKKILEFTKHGLIIKYTKDLKAYTKLIPALKEYPNALIATADDDIFYPQDWLEKLYNSWKDNKDCVVCHRAHRIEIKEEKIIPYNSWEKMVVLNVPSFCNFLTGVGGVLYPPNVFYKDVLNEELYKKLSPRNDDIWFWAMAVLNGTKIKIVDEPINHLIYVNPEREIGLNGDFTLLSSNVNKNENDIQFENVINYYPQIMENLLNV